MNSLIVPNVSLNNTTNSTMPLNDTCFVPSSPETVSSPLAQNLLIILYSATALTAFVGNVIVIAVQFYDKVSPRHNIRKYLINLALADIIFAVFCVPFTYMDFMLGRWVAPNWMCPTTQYVQLLSVFITANTLTIIGVERYTATLYPFSSFHRWLRSNSYTLIGLTWIFGCFYSYIPIENTYAQEVKNAENVTLYYECNYDNNLDFVKKRVFNGANLLLTFGFPLFVLLFSYTAIMRKLMWRRPLLDADSTPTITTATDVSNSNSSNAQVSFVDQQQSLPGCYEIKYHKRSSEASQGKGTGKKTSDVTTGSDQIVLRRSCSHNYTKSRRKTIKILLVVIILYIVCWMPLKTYQFLLEFGVIDFCSESQYYIQVYTYIACHWLAMSNSFVNPIVYSFMSQRFRNDLQRIITKYVLHVN